MIGERIFTNLGVSLFQVKSAIKDSFRPVVQFLNATVSANPGNVEDDEDDETPNEVNGAASVLLFTLWNILLIVSLVISVPGPYTFVASMVAMLTYVACLFSALLVIDEETDLWNGLVAESKRRFENHTNIKSAAFLIISTAFFVISLSVCALQWDHLSPTLPFIAKTPNTLCWTGM
jgi:hypothetical protein